ncbi:MAG: hypothetical protein V7L14_02370 [Nostoc sp.]
MSHPPIAKGGQDAHPTRLDNLFVGNPLVSLFLLKIDRAIASNLRSP